MTRERSVSKFQTTLSAVVYLSLLLFAGLTTVREGLSFYYANAAKTRNSFDEAARALAVDEGNPEAYKVAAHVLHDTNDYRRAAEILERGVRIKPHDFLMWLRLGYVRSLGGDAAGARAAYEKALALAPHYAQPNRYLGRLLLADGEPEAAFRHLARAAEQQPALFPEVLRLARERYPNDGAAIERALAFEAPASRRTLALYLIRHGLATAATRDRMLDESLADADKQEYVNALLEAKNYPLAREVWAAMKNRRPLLEKPADEFIVDGGFERLAESDESGFAWQVNAKLADTETKLDETKSADGRRSILLSLKGKTDPDAKILFQRVIVAPEQNYRLQFAVNSSEIVSNGGLAVFVAEADTGRVIGQSPAFRQTQGKWEPLQFNFRAGAAPAVDVFVRRLPCTTSPCPIFADTNLDSFSLKKTAP